VVVVVVESIRGPDVVLLPIPLQLIPLLPLPTTTICFPGALFSTGW